MMISFPKNSLNVSLVGIEPFPKFMEKFAGRTVTIWIGAEPILYSIDKLSRFTFVTGPDMLILFGSKSNIKFSVPLGNGFGLKIKGGSEHFWVDKFNETEALVIEYKADGWEYDLMCKNCGKPLKEMLVMYPRFSLLGSGSYYSYFHADRDQDKNCSDPVPVDSTAVKMEDVVGEK